MRALKSAWFIVGRAQGTPLAVLASLLLAAASAQAGTFSAPTSAPAVQGYDIANLVASTGSDKWYNDGKGLVASAAKGLTFTTGNSQVLFKSLTYKCDGSNLKAASTSTPTIYTVRVGTLSGTTFTQLYSETFSQMFTNAPGSYMTWTFDSPVLLANNTTYAVDVAMTTAGLAWNYGIPYLSISGNTYAGGQLYNSGANGVGAATVTFTSTQDRIFHLHLLSPMVPSPDTGSTNNPGGNKVLSWSNLSPVAGTDVWVDVWFGTNQAALTRVVTAGLNTTNVTVSAPVAATYYWRVDSYLNGAPTGTPVTGTLWNFVVTDTDGDGIPDWWMLQYFGHPTAQAGDLSRPGDDPDGDGLSNLQEYQLGTSPTNADTDGDGLKDGDELNLYHTSPTLSDTDGDGLGDGAEVNTYHTNPLLADTDGDGLSDGDEVNLYHTDPLNSDTDGDGAGDWYEVMAAYTDPLDPKSKPNIPYPLPKPNGSTGATNKPVKVFILSGQSNMVGMSDVNPLGTPGTLSTIVKQQGKFPDLLDTNGNWALRNNVYYKGVITATAAGPLQPGQGSDSTHFGPELGFGRVMGYYFNEPVLVLKTSQGNRGLFWDIKPPGSPETTNGTTIYAGYGESPNSWTVGSGPSPFVWYAGKQYDDFFLDESDMGPTVAWASGVSYPVGCQLRHNGMLYSSTSTNASSAATEPGVGTSWTSNWSLYSVSNVVDVLDNFATLYPQWAAQGFEIAGYVWWQGHWDANNGALSANQYETNLCNLIRTVRHYYENRYPSHVETNAPWVMADIGFDGWAMTNTPGDVNFLTVANAQLAVGDPAKHPEFAGTVKTVESRGYWRTQADSPNSQWYHYWHNAETYMLVGDALGRGMVSMLSAGTDASRPAFRSYGPRSGTAFPLSFSGPNGQSYKLLCTTNVLLPMASWTVLTNGTFGASPQVYLDTTATNARQYYRIQSP